MTVLSILAGWLLTAAACGAAGLLLERLARLSLPPAERWPLAFLTGSAFLSLLVLALGLCHALTAASLVVLCALLIAGALVGARRAPAAAPLTALPLFWRWLFLALFSVQAFLVLVNALAPEVSPDGSAYHLEVVSLYLRRHAVVFVPTNMYAAMPAGLEMLFLPAFAVGRHSAAALVHATFLLALPWLVLAHARRLGAPAAGVAAALLFMATPVVAIDGASAYNDVALASAAFGAYHLLARWRDQRAPGWLILAGLLAGFCIAVKYTGAFVLPAACAFVLSASRRRARDLTLVLGPALVVVAPWLVKNAVWTGNPLAPFFNHLFPNPYWSAFYEASYRNAFLHLPGDVSRAAGLLDALHLGRYAGGTLGPLWFLAPIALLSLRRAAGFAWLCAAIVLLPGYAANYGARFLIPALPFLALAIALPLDHRGVRALLAILAAVQVALGWPQIRQRYAPVAWSLSEVPWRAALRLEPEDAFFSRRLPDYFLSRMIDRHVPVNESVFAPDSVPQAYTTRTIIVGYESNTGLRLINALWMPLNPALPPRRDLVFRFPRRRLRGLRLRTAQADAALCWRIGEIDLYLDNRLLPRPAARLEPFSNPWDAAMAWDSSVATAWEAHEALAPGQTFDIEFDSPATLDEVRAGVSLIQPTNVQLLELRPGAAPQLLTGTAAVRDRLLPENLRREAVLAALHMGCRWMFVRRGGVGESDFLDHRAEWGITLVAEHDGHRLYRLDAAER
jgi:hypothetical protein